MSHQCRDYSTPCTIVNVEYPASATIVADDKEEAGHTRAGGLAGQGGFASSRAESSNRPAGVQVLGATRANPASGAPLSK